MDRPLCEVLRYLHACGWSCFELSSEHLEELANASTAGARIVEVRSTLQELSATMPQAHALLSADIAHPEEAQREADLRVLERHLDCCAELGITHVTIHPGGQNLTTREDFRRALRYNIENLNRLAERANRLSLKIGLENTLDEGSEYRVFGSVPEELLDLIARVGSTVLGVTFDTSHANVRKLDLGSTIRQFGTLICCTHISDNDGSGDQHRMPGSGTIDWSSVMAAFYSIGYRGAFNLEIPGEEQSNVDLLRLKLMYAREITGWLVSQGSGFTRC